MSSLLSLSENKPGNWRLIYLRNSLRQSFRFQKPPLLIDVNNILYPQILLRLRFRPIPRPLWCWTLKVLSWSNQEQESVDASVSILYNIYCSVKTISATNRTLEHAKPISSHCQYPGPTWFDDRNVSHNGQDPSSISILLTAAYPMSMHDPPLYWVVNRGMGGWRPLLIEQEEFLPVLIFDNPNIP